MTEEIQIKPNGKLSVSYTELHHKYCLLKEQISSLKSHGREANIIRIFEEETGINLIKELEKTDILSAFLRLFTENKRLGSEILLWKKDHQEMVKLKMLKLHTKREIVREKNNLKSIISRKEKLKTKNKLIYNELKQARKTIDKLKTKV